ncbi:MAG: sigma factor [Saprospiraceae bacterium]|nr:sigma factor [Saprospiraceae bacterium]
MENQIIDHLFRHQYGKMVSILTNIFGLPHLETIEDAVQDIFIKAMIKWRNQIPENPEAWLTAAAKNRVIDLLRKIK